MLKKIELPPDWIDAIDAKRGNESLSSWVRKQIKRGLRGVELTEPRKPGNPTFGTKDDATDARRIAAKVKKGT